MTEQVFDEDIGPALLRIAETCKEKGMDFVAYCEWEKKKGSSTAQFKDASMNIQMIYAAIQAQGNLDQFMFWAIKHARKYGHSSVFLQQLNVPLKPDVEVK